MNQKPDTAWLARVATVVDGYPDLHLTLEEARLLGPVILNQVIAANEPAEDRLKNGLTAVCVERGDLVRLELWRVPQGASLDEGHIVFWASLEPYRQGHMPESPERCYWVVLRHHVTDAQVFLGNRGSARDMISALKVYSEILELLKDPKKVLLG